jgi:predicted RNA-binding Zn ribbon-like protein
MMDVAHLPLVGGNPALDLVNTVERGMPAPGTLPVDFLATAGDLVVWAERAELISPDEVVTIASTWSDDERASIRALARLHELREAVHLAVLAQLGATGWEDTETRSALDLLGRRWAAAVSRSQLRPAGAHGPIMLDVGTDPGYLIEDRLADAAIALLSGPESARMHRCPVELGGCGWVFVDRSRNSSRTWCRMADCGNQVKARRLTERRRQIRMAGQPGQASRAEPSQAPSSKAT